MRKLGLAAVAALALIGVGLSSAPAAINNIFAYVTNGGTGLSAVAVHQVLVGTAANVYTAKTLPDCTDTAGQHLNFTQSSDTFSCGVSALSGLINVQIFASGSATYTSTTGTTQVVVETQGSGAGGGGTPNTGAAENAYAGAGSGGSYAMTHHTSAFSGVTVTVGAAGAAGAAGANAGGAGNISSFGALVSCPGGLGGAAGGNFTAATPGINGSVNGANPAACTVSGTTIKSIVGGIGSPVMSLSLGQVIGGGGGSSGIGTGASPAYSQANGSAGLGYGSGGGGAAGTSAGGTRAGGAGTVGRVIVYEYR